MRELHKVFGLVFSLGVLITPVIHAAEGAPPPPDPNTPYSTSAKTNGSLASSLESAITKFLTTNELKDLGYSMYSEGVSNPQQTSVQNHITTYCSANVPTEASAFGCKITGPMGIISQQELGDVKASVLLDYTTLGSISATTAQTYIRNLLMPGVSTKYREMIANTEAFGKNGNLQAQYAKFLSNTAAVGLSVYSMENMYSMRATGAALGVSGSGAADQSLLSVMENQATQRYASADYVDWLMGSSADELAVLRDMALMQSFGIWMQYQNYRQNERIEALLAALLAKATAFSMSQDAMTGTR